MSSAPRALRPPFPASSPRFDALFPVPDLRRRSGTGRFRHLDPEHHPGLARPDADPDAGAVGLTAAFQFLPALLLGPLGGRFADRLPGPPAARPDPDAERRPGRRHGGAGPLGAPDPWEIYLVAVLAGLVWVVDNPARQALVSDLVGPSALRSAVALNGAIFQSARIVAPALAGVLITAAGPATAFCVDTAFFAAGLLVWSRLRTPTPAARLRPATGRTETSSGYLRHQPRTAVAILLVGVVGTFGLNFPVVLTVIAADDFHGGAEPLRRVQRRPRARLDRRRARGRRLAGQPAPPDRRARRRLRGRAGRHRARRSTGWRSSAC